MIINPIIRGFNPDPSVCEVNGEYYLAVSSFEYFPGIPIYKSSDLVNWELINHAIDNNKFKYFDYFNLEDSEGIFAPTLRYNSKTEKHLIYIKEMALIT